MHAREIFNLLVAMGYTLDVMTDGKQTHLRFSPAKETLSPVLRGVVDSVAPGLVSLVQIKLAIAETNRRIAASAPADWEFPADDSNWSRREAVLEAHAARLDLDGVKAACSDYEGFAMGQFMRLRLDASPVVAAAVDVFDGVPSPVAQPEWIKPAQKPQPMLQTKPAEPVLARIREALDVLAATSGAADFVTELRVLGAGRTGRRVDVGYFDAQHFGDMANAAFRASRNGAMGVYFTPNPLSPELLARAANRVKEASNQSAKDADVIARAWFVIDLDSARPAGISSTDDELAEAHALACEVSNWLADRGWPQPVVGSSGNGAHLLYRVDLPNDDDTKATFKNCLLALAQRFDSPKVKIDPAVYNAARIWKLYGTVSRKGDHLPDRPHRLASIESIPTPAPQRVEPKLLAALAAEYKPPQVKSRAAPGASRLLLSHRDRINLARGWLKKCDPAVSGTGGHNTTFRVACDLVKGFDLAPDLAVELFRVWNATCVPPWSDKDLFRKLNEADKAPDKDPRGYLLPSEN